MKNYKDIANQILSSIDNEEAQQMLDANKKAVGEEVKQMLLSVLRNHLKDVPEDTIQQIADEFTDKFKKSVIDEPEQNS